LHGPLKERKRFLSFYYVKINIKIRYINVNNLIKQIVESKFNFNIDAEGNDMNSLSKSKYNSKS